MAEVLRQDINNPAVTETPPQELARLEELLNSANVADKLTEEELDKIADDLVKRIQEDIRSMDGWTRKYNDYVKLALQIKEKKSFPWPNAANTKYPLLTMAALQFHARMYPAVVNGKSIVKGKVIGYDPTGEKAKRAERVGKFQTYQLMEQIHNWDEDMDKLGLVLPIAGCVFKDISWDSVDERINVELVLPTDMIVNYWAKSMDDARRITRRLYYYENTIKEFQAEKLFLDVELSPPVARSKSPEEDKNQGRTFYGSDENDLPYEIWKCQTWLDLDKDKYKEPYIVYIEPNDKKILRIQPNYELADVRKTSSGKISRIRAKRNFIKFDFIPAPDGGLFGVGFGLLLGSLNEVVNTNINQLIDQGTMHTTGGGFLGKGVRMAGGALTFEPNEWKILPVVGDDIKKNVFPLPVREPSDVLLQLMQFLVQSGKEVIAISEIATGKLPGQNTPATTTITSVEEGMKIFTAIYKRIHRQLKKEFKRIFELNSVHITDEEYFQVLDSSGGVMDEGMVSAEDFNSEDVDVAPESDPNVASDVLRLTKAQQLVELIPLGAVDPAKAGMRILEALDVPNPQELAPQPQPDPAVMKAQADIQAKQQIAQVEMRMKEMELQFKQKEGEMKLQLKQMELQLKEVEMHMNAQISQQQHQQTMQQNDESHRQSIEQQREQHKVDREAPQQKTNGGKSDNKGTSK